MRWSSPIKNKQQEADQNTTVLDYKPRDFILGTPEAALQYLERKKEGSDFVLSDVIRLTTGVDEIEKQSEENRVENKVLHRLTKIQQQAYEEGFKLGKDEGYAAALEKHGLIIKNNLEDLKNILDSIQSLKPDLVLNNEAHLINLIYQIAEKISYDHIEQKPEVILQVIKKSIETAQAEEDVTVLINTAQVDFIETYKNSEDKNFDFLKNIKVLGSEDILPGGCIIETNYGSIDATLQQRFSKIWNELVASAPKIKDKLGT